MWDFFRRNKKQEVVELDIKLQKAFGSIDSDIQRIQHWITHIYHSHKGLENSHKREVSIKQKDVDTLSKWVGYLHKHSTDIHNRVVSIQKESELFSRRLDEVERRLSQVQSGSVRTEPALKSEPEPNRTEPVVKRSSFEERVIVNHIRPNRKNYVIQEILSEIKAEDITTKQLETAIVREKKLCGRTTFYAHYKELKDKGIIDIANVGSKAVLVVKN